jgi:hypothetical protein
MGIHLPVFIWATRQTTHNGANVNVQGHQIATLLGANIGRGAAGGRRGMKWKTGPHCIFRNCG